MLQEAEAGLGGDDETRWHVEPDLRHLAQVSPLTTEQHLVLSITFFEGIVNANLPHMFHPSVFVNLLL